MSVSAEEVIGAVASRPGVPIGRIEGGQVVPYAAPRRAHHAYPTYEAMADEVARTLDALYPDIDPVFRRIQRSPHSGAWVRVVREHTGETRPQQQQDGGTIVFAATVKKERPVALTLESAAAVGADWFWPGRGWVRRGSKREFEDPENLGHQATEQVEWEQLEYRSPSPNQPPAAVALKKER